MFNKMISSTFLLAIVFSSIAMFTTTIMRYTDHMTANQWLAALSTCSVLILGVIGKRAVDGVGKAFGKKGGDNA